MAHFIEHMLGHEEQGKEHGDFFYHITKKFEPNCEKLIVDADAFHNREEEKKYWEFKDDISA